MRRVPTFVWIVVAAAICVGLDFGYDFAVDWNRGYKFWLTIAIVCAINVLGATSLNIVNGMAGQFSIGHAGFVGLGAYVGGWVAARLGLALGTSLDAMHDNLPLAQSFLIVPIVIVVVAIVCALVGFVVGLPSLRLRGDYLAIVTLGFSEILRLLILGTVEDTAKNPVTKAIASLGGSLGYRGPQIGDDFAGIPSVAGPFWTIGIAALAVFLALRFKRSGFGRALRAVREDEIAASAVGVDPAKYKVTAFVLAAMGAGVAGALLVLRRDGPGIVSPATMKFDKSFEVITMVILGGSGSVSGAAVGAVLYTAIFYLSEELLLDLQRNGVSFFAEVDAAALRMTLFAAALIIVMLVRPEGLFGEREVWERPKPKGRGGPPDRGEKIIAPEKKSERPPSERDLPGALET
jgi:branched-chain amino acid transport system permease protein